MRFALVICAAAALLGAPAPPAHSSPYKGANAYFYVRDKAQLVESYTPEEVQTQPAKFAGRLVEVRGVVTAVAGSENQTTLLLEAGENGPAVPVSLPPDKGPAEWSFLDVGSSIRALCQVVTLAGSSSGSLELVIPVKEHEAVAVDQERAKVAAAKTEALRQRTQSSSRPPTKASRGLGAGTMRQAAQPRFSRSQVLDAYSSAVRYFNRRLTPAQSQKIATTIIEYSLRYGLDARLVMAVVAVESNFNQHAVSPVGAMGLGQLMPGTAGDLGVGNAFDLRQNLEGSTRLLKNHIVNMSDGRPTGEAIKLALACYNAGAGAVKKYKGIPPYRETQNYVKKITRLYRQMCGLDT
jgi:hypothetical protein